MLKIYGTSGSRALRTLWAAEECGVEFEHIPTHFVGEAQQKDYLSLNPNGKVPTMVDGDLVMFESMAINLYLAENYGGSLWPAAKADRARALQWSVWGVAEVENHTIPIVWELMFKTDEADRDMVSVEQHRQALGRPLRMLNRHLGQNAYLLGDEFSIADVNVSGTVSLAQIDWSPYPEIVRWQACCQARPAYQRAKARA
jgi:glutathione S-transferase